MNFANALKCTKELVLAGKTGIIEGSPGVGKTDLIHQASAELDWHEPLVTHPAVADPTDYKGMPVADGKGGYHFAPIGMVRVALEWKPEKGPVILFVDDVGQAVPAVHNSLMQFAWEDSRQLDGKKLPPEVRIMMATNRKEDRANVGSFSTALKGRTVIYNLEPDINSWLDWAAVNGVNPILMAYLTMCSQHLNDPRPSGDLKQSPNPRTWKILSDLTLMNFPDDCRKELYSGCVGEDQAVQYLAFERIWAGLPDLRKVMHEPDSVPVPNETNIRFAMVNALSRQTNCKSQELRNIMRYLRKFPDEFKVLWTTMVVRLNEQIQITEEFTNWAVENQKIMQ
jgi:hypothetical protein